MAIRYTKQYKIAAPDNILDDLYNPLDDLNGGGGGSTGGGGMSRGGGKIENPIIKIFLKNISTFKNKMTFNVQGQNYDETSTIVIDANTINDTLIIKPIVNDEFTLKNWFEIEKVVVSNAILINGVYETIQSTGINIITYNEDGVKQGNRDYSLPQSIPLEFDLKSNVIIKPKPSKTQNVSFVCNYINLDLLNELKITLTTNGLIYSLNNLGVKNDIDITAVSFDDLKIDISGLNKFSPKNIRWQYANKFNDNSTFDVNDFNIIGTAGEATIPANVFNNNIIVVIEVEPNTANFPKLVLDNTIINVNIVESIFASTTDTQEISIGFKLSNTDVLKVITPYKQFNSNLTANSFTSLEQKLDLKKDFQNNTGTFKIILVPYSNFYGDGTTQTIIVNINKIPDIPIIDKIEYPTKINIPIYSFGNVSFKIEYESKLATKVLIYHTKEDDNYILASGVPNTSYNGIYNTIKSFLNKGTLDLLLVPYNKNIKGEIERISISFDDPGFYISTQNLKDELFNAISSELKFDLTKPNYLNHIASFDVDDKQIIISNWDIDTTTFTKFKTDELGNQIPDGEINKSIVLKLYEPLPSNINKNDTLWVSQLSALPILQSVILTGISEDMCVPLRAPNFGVEIDFVKEQSTGFESYDNLILSGSTTSQQIVDKYLTENFIDVKGINIDYTNLSNFVKYSSAVERLANFRYKKELAEWYDDKIVSQSVSASATTITLNLDIVNYQTKKSNLITGFDGWETYLTQSVFTGSFSEPTSLTIYTDYLDSATTFDRNNNNALKNNIPLHIIEDNGNIDYLLFLDMIGNYFDIIWAYIKGMSDQKKISETNMDGIEDKFLYQYLQSFGWNAKNLNSNKQLWDYTFGLNNNAQTGSFTSNNIQYLPTDTKLITPEKATHQIWRRIANNLPYLLKHKGSQRGINALLTCYGIAASNLSIMEFGGPNLDSVEDSPKFIYNSLTHNLVFDNITASLNIPFTGAIRPQAIELKLKPSEFANYTLLSGSGFRLGISVNGHGSNKFGNFTINGSQVSGSSYPFYDGNYHSILVNKTGSIVDLYVKTNDKDRIIQSGEWSGSIVDANYETATSLMVKGFKGHLEEIRLWETNLSESVFNNHVIMPEAINGNHISASTTDLLLRLDFERPQNLASNRTINNIAPNLEYVAAVSASGFISASSYPYNYEALEREVALTIPNSGASRYYTNKVRLESQTLTSNLSPLHRSTKKAFETAPQDSNRVGLFFSPNKDLDLDIAKSLGGESFDDFIGDPQYEYNTINYPELDELRNYYFGRVGERNLYEFIRLIKFYDKSLFVNLKEMLPVRAVATTGLLIAPHLLERNRIKINRPEATAESLEGVVTETQITDLSSTFDYKEANLNLTASIENISAINETLDGTLIASDVYNFSAEADSFTTIIDTDLANVVNGSYISYEGEIDFRLKDPTILTELDLNYGKSIIGFDRYSDYGYGTYFNSGYGKYFYEENGAFKSKAVKAFLVTKVNNNLSTNLVRSGSVGVLGSEYTYVDSSSLSTELIVQEYSPKTGLFATASLVDNKTILSAVAVNGYLPSHYIYKGDKHTGIENLFYKGCKQTIDTTIDGKAAVETFTTNPTKLRVTAQGRSNNEPILEVD